MAKFNAQGIDGLQLDMKAFEEIPDAVVEDMLDEAGKVVKKAHKERLRQLGLVDSHKLMESITAVKKAGGKSNDFRRYVVVYPAGSRGKYKRKLVTREYKRSKHGTTYTVGGDIKPIYNNDVGFVHEYGAPKRGIKAKQWMRTANELCANEMTRAEYAVYSAWLESINL